MTDAKTLLERREKALAWNRERNARIRADPILRAKKLEANRKSAKKHYDKRRAYDKARDKQKMHARAAIRNRIYTGTLVRQSCEKCGLPNAHAHHDDYSRPLEIRWLCPLHHKEYHNEHKSED